VSGGGRGEGMCRLCAEYRQTPPSVHTHTLLYYQACRYGGGGEGWEGGCKANMEYQKGILSSFETGGNMSSGKRDQMASIMRKRLKKGER